MKEYPRILLLMDTDRAYERGLVTGILRYSRLHGPFNFMRSEPEVLGGLHHLTMGKIRRWRPQGVIWREGSPIKKVQSLGVPTIYFPTSEPKPDCCNVLTDDCRIGEMAAAHLIEKGLEHFAYCGLDDTHYWSQGRKRGFVESIANQGFEVEEFDLLDSGGQLKNWMAHLKLPVGLMVCTDDCSMECYKTIRDLELRIPEDVAIVGVGNDDLVCDFANPPLSSVQLNLEQAGFNAMRRLSAAIAGEESREDIVVETFDIAERQSSNFMAVDDELVSTALKFIYQHRNDPIGVEDVVRQVPTSRRVLYRRFKKSLGRTIAKEIRIVRINHAARMLLDTNFTIAEICDRLKFDAPQNFTRTFLREKGMTPFKYRTKHSFFR